MLTALMPAMANALRGVLTDQQTRGLMQALGNCNQPLVHNAPVSVTAQMPQGSGPGRGNGGHGDGWPGLPGNDGGMFNANYWTWSDFNDIVNFNNSTTNNSDNRVFGGNTINNNFNNSFGDTFTYLNNLFNAYNTLTTNTHNHSTTNLNNTFNYNHGGDSFYDFSDRSTIRLGDIYNVTNRGGDTIITLVNNPPGQRGERGARGSDGRDGRDGAAGTAGTRGEAGPQGEPGPPGLAIVGPAGPQGQEGPAGKDGLQGPAGPPGVTTVVFVGGEGGVSKQVLTGVTPQKSEITFMIGGEVECNEDGGVSFTPQYVSLDLMTGIKETKETIRVLR